MIRSRIRSNLISPAITSRSTIRSLNSKSNKTTNQISYLSSSTSHGTLKSSLTSKRNLSTSTPTSSDTVSTQSATPKRPRFYSRHPIIFTIVAFPFLLSGSVGIIIVGLLAYDATTYQDKHVERVARDELSLHPIRGGKKNLKIAEVLVDDDDDRARNHNKKQKLVIIGGGWGSVGILKHLDRDLWHVTVVSPDNYFLFHPLLPSATVGTVELRSLVEPLRKILARVSGHFIQARAVDLDFSARLVEIQSAEGDENFYLPYDKLVIACGSVNSTHGVPGLENCYQLKTVPDAQRIRQAISNNLEKAALPSTEEAERKRLLSFTICGGGPTGERFSSYLRLDFSDNLYSDLGVEFASELFDMINEDVTAYVSNPQASFIHYLLIHFYWISDAKCSSRRYFSTHNSISRSYSQHLFSKD